MNGSALLTGFMIYLTAWCVSSQISGERDENNSAAYLPEHYHDSNYFTATDDMITDDGSAYLYDYEETTSSYYDPGFDKRCDCTIDRSDDEFNCSQDVRFQSVMKCDNTTVYIGGKCREHENRDIDFTDFCDGVRSCSGGQDEPRQQVGFKCPLQTFYKTPEVNGQRCTLPRELIDRWRDVDDPTVTVYSICPDKRDICFKNNGTLDIEKCFQCLDGLIININQVCDGIVDCLDLSDECLCRHKSNETVAFCESQSHCDSDQISWGNSSVGYSCHPKSKFTDINGLDLKDCPKCINTTSERKSLFTCSPDGLNDIEVTKCDKRPRCGMYLDDECGAGCEETPEFCGHILVGTYNCWPIDEAARAKIDDESNNFYICDGLVDCINATDEIGCDRIACGNDSYNSTYDKLERCNMVLDCDNGADEVGCPGRRYCNDHKQPGLLPEKFGDGKLDCEFGEDECDYSEDSFSSGQNMMKNPFFLTCTWVLALLAIMGNAMVIRACSMELHIAYQRGTITTNRARVGICNKILVLNLAIADFLMGIYLLTLGIKAIEYKGIYCAKWQEWRSSSLCSGIGALAMLSSQASVMIMVMMTSYRFYSVRSPFKAERVKARYLVAGVLVLCWLPPLFVAFFPLRTSTMAFAMQPTAKLRHFTSFIIEKDEFGSFVYEAWNAANKTADTFGGFGWPGLVASFCELFSEVCGNRGEAGLVNKWYGYYSADSVCLPRLFPKVGDSGWGYTAGVVLFDFVAFIYILFAYSTMYVCTVRRFSAWNSGRSRSSAFNSSEVRSREDRVIWRRISRLIVTDFLCWVPMCITTMVSLSGYRVQPLMYQISAIVFLPINSALNPFLYSNVVCRTVQRVASSVKQKLKPNTGNRARASSVPGVVLKAQTPSATYETRASRDGLASENKSLIMSEIDKNKNACTPSSKLIESDEKGRNNRDAEGAEGSTGAATDGKSVLSECIAKFGFRRFFSERKAKDFVSDERSTLPRRHRPKSQSTTSTATTFTSCGEA